MDKFDSYSEHVCGFDTVKLTNNAPNLGNQFKLKLCFKYDDGEDGAGQLIGGLGLMRKQRSGA